MAKTPMHPTIWIDLENTPHVPFFVPIILDLEAAGCQVLVTARDFAQTRALVEAAGITATFIGHEYGDHSIRKAFGILARALQLAIFLRAKNIRLAVAHGSRGLLLASKLLRIPSLTLYDYEGASVRLFNKLSTWVMTPAVLPFEKLALLGLANAKHRTYKGLKEDVYVSHYTPRPLNLRIDPAKIIVTVRPPSHTAHYRSADSFALFESIIQVIAMRRDVHAILLARTVVQRAALKRQFHDKENIIIPQTVLPGLDLLYASDLVIGGGGTVNREAAALGVPVVTIFKGPMGAVDQWLIASGKMMEITSADQITPLLKREILPC